MKLLFITYTHSNGGGAENVLTTLVNHLDPARYKIDIIEVNQFLVKKEPLNQNVHLLNPMVKANHKYTDRVIVSILREKPEIIKSLFRLYGYDVIIAWDYQLPSFCLRSFEQEIKIAWFHGSIYNFLPDAIDAKSELDKQLQLETWKTADRIVTISGKSLQSLKDIFPELASKAEIIHNGCDFSRIHQLSMIDPEKKIPIGSSNIIIGIGRLEDNKNFELLIRAASRVIHSGIDCFLFILGKGELFSELEKIAVQENIRNSVSFAGYQQNPYPYYKLSKIVCCTSFSEGWGMNIVEGMTLGKPFVTTPVAGASEELADNGRCGLVSGWDVEEYANHIKKLLTDHNLYEQMSKSCVEKAKEFSVENNIIKFNVLIKRLHASHVSRRIANGKEDRNMYKRIYAVYCYALFFALIDLKAPRITGVFQRYKNNSTFINGIKLLYHFSLFVVNPFLSPFKFFVGLVKACFLGF